jgi:hypothetical protein
MAMCGVAEEPERGIEWGKENLKDGKSKIYICSGTKAIDCCSLPCICCSYDLYST